MITLLFLLLVLKPEILGLDVEKSDSELIVDIVSNKAIDNYKTFTLKEPERIIVDLPGAILRLEEHKKIVNIEPLIRIRTGEKEWNGKKGARIVLDLTSSTPFDISPKGETLKISLKLQNPKKYEVYFYRSRGKRDPFEPLITEEDEESDSLLAVGNAELVGIITEGDRKVALLKDAKGKGFVLRKGDRVQGGSVVEITENSVAFLLSDYGISRRVVLKMKKESSRRAK